MAVGIPGDWRDGATWNRRITVRWHIVARRQILIGCTLAVLGSVGAGLFLFQADNSVTVDVINSSSRPIQSAALTHEGGVQVLGEMRVGESRRVKFQPRGETTYHITVKFDDGAELSGGGAYAEAGYAFSETVTDSAITNRLERLGY